MSTPTTITRIAPVLSSPTNLQYIGYAGKAKSDSRSPYFKPRFTFRTEDRKHSFPQKLSKTDPLMPPYPYGKDMKFKEANFGLYGGTTLQSGHKISKGRNKGKTLRHFFPNVRIDTLRSEALGTDFRIPVTARVRRTIRKCGGLDAYVCGTKPARIKELGLLGWKLRWLVMTSPSYRERFAQQRQEYGLTSEQDLTASFEDVWNDERLREPLVQQQDAAWEDLRQAAARFEAHVQRHWTEDGVELQYRLPKLTTLETRSPGTLGLPTSLQTAAPTALTRPRKAVARSRKQEPRPQASKDAGPDVGTPAPTTIEA